MTTELHSAVQQPNAAACECVLLCVSLLISNAVSVVRSGTKQNNRAEGPTTRRRSCGLPDLLLSDFKGAASYQTREAEYLSCVDVNIFFNLSHAG